MATRSPIPSKHAVRALRSLALSTPLVFAGATGGACCLAAVHYEIRQRILLAEKIVRTKRAVHSVSSGKGKAHVSNLLKAAENGDDFLLNSCQHGQRRQRRKLSALAVQSEISDSEMENLHLWQPAPVGPSKVKDKSTDHSVMSFTSLSSRSVFRDKGVQKDRDIRIQDTTMADVRRKNSDSAKYFTKPRLFPKKYESSDNPTKLRHSQTKSHLLHTENQRWVALIEARKADATSSKTRRELMIPIEARQGDVSRSRKHQDPGNRYQVQTDLHSRPKKSSKIVKVTNEASNPIVFNSYEPNSGFGGLARIDDTFDSYETGVHDHDDVEETGVKTAEVLFQSCSENPKHTDHDFTLSVPYLPVGDVPNHRRHERPSKFAAKKPEYQQLIQDAGFERYEFIYHHLMLAFKTPRTNEDLALLEGTIRKHMQSKTREDLALAKLLIKEFRKLTPYKSWVEILQRLTKEQFEQSNTPDGSVPLLYMTSIGEHKTIGRHQHRYARQYLTQQCDKNISSELLVQETIKILKETVAAKLSPDDSLLAPLIRNLCMRGEIAQAEIILKNLSTEFGFEPTHLTLTEIIRGHARNGDWTKIDRMLSQLHEAQGSRQRFHGYAALLQRVLEEYVQRKSPEQIYDFLTYYIHGFGLVPTGPISNIALEAFTRSRRYDLIREWVRERQLRFPALRPATSTNDSVVTIGKAWHEMRASTEEVLYACTAMADVQIRNPFSKMFRAVAMEAASEAINTCVQQLCRTLPQQKEIHPLKSANDLHGLLELADRTLALLPSGSLHSLQQKLLKDKLIRQIRAANDLVSLLRGNVVREENVRRPVQALVAAETAKGVPSDTSDPDILAILSHIPAELKKESLPSPAKVEELVQQFYLKRKEHGLRPDHNILRYVATKMIRQQREREALSLLEIIHKSSWAQARIGTPFDTEIFGTWIDLICQIRHPSKFSEVLWAILDSDVELKITTRFFALVRHTQNKVTDPRLRRLSVQQHKESDYLRKRFSRRAREEGCRFELE